MTSTPPARLLIVDDEAANMRALCDTLRERGYETAGVASGEEALKALRDGRFDLLLTDLMMPGMDGVALLTAALEVDPQLAGVLMTGRGTIETAVNAMKAGALDYVLKPIRLNAILPVLSRALAVRRLRLENMELRNSVAIHELNRAIANTLDPNVLLKRIVDAVHAQLEADEVSIMLLSEDGRYLEVVAARSDRRETLLGARQPVGEGIAGRVAARREPLVLEGEVTDRALAPPFPRKEIRTALCMPMITRGKLIGVLNVNSTREAQRFSQGRIEVLSIFTNAAAAGIEAARLHDEHRKADARYREVLQMAGDAIISFDSAGRIVIFNDAAEKICGWTSAEMAGRPVDLLFPDRLAEAYRERLSKLYSAREVEAVAASQGQLYARRQDGSEFPIEISASRLDQGGERVFTIVLRDITQRVEQDARIARLTRLYAVLSGINSAIVRATDEGELFFEICRIAVDEGKLAGAWIGSFDADTREIALVASAGGAVTERRYRVDPAEPGGQGLLATAALEAQLVWENDLAARPGLGYLRRDIPNARSGAALPFVLDGKVRAVMLLYADVADAFGDDEIRLLREMAGDVSFALDHIAKTRQVDYLATHDQLTGLPNRSLFMDRLEQAVAAARDNGETLAVVLTDIERFKQVNDSFGRSAGDAVLREVASRLQQLMGSRSSLARVVADVFGMMQSDIAQAAEIARTVRERMNAVMADAFSVDGQSLNLATRAGVAIFPADGGDAEALFRNAEAALKRAKSQREGIVFYTPDLNARVAQQIAMESRLRGALDRGEFVLHYQPKVDLETRRVAGLEALLRWQDPTAGLVPPLQFIPLLEETGMILQVGRWAMEEAVRTAAALRAKGLPPVRIAVNVSAIQLRDADFVRSVEAAIASGGGNPHGLDLEITESVIMHDIDANVRALTALREMGVELAIDDFGTGYSSLAYIARLPVGVIKIDRAFIRNLWDDADSASIVQTIISLTHSLKRKVVAEGVETGDQAKLLRLLRCDQFQGYLFSKPVPANEIEGML